MRMTGAHHSNVAESARPLREEIHMLTTYRSPRFPPSFANHTTRERWYHMTPVMLERFIRRNFLLTGPAFANGHVTYEQVKALLPTSAMRIDRERGRLSCEEEVLLLNELERAYGFPTIDEIRVFGEEMPVLMAQAEYVWRPMRARSCPHQSDCIASRHVCTTHRMAIDDAGRNYLRVCHADYWHHLPLEDFLLPSGFWRS